MEKEKQAKLARELVQQLELYIINALAQTKYGAISIKQMLRAVRPWFVANAHNIFQIDGTRSNGQDSDPYKNAVINHVLFYILRKWANFFKKEEAQQLNKDNSFAMDWNNITEGLYTAVYDVLTNECLAVPWVAFDVYYDEINSDPELLEAINVINNASDKAERFIDLFLFNVKEELKKVGTKCVEGLPSTIDSLDDDTSIIIAAQAAAILDAVLEKMPLHGLEYGCAIYKKLYASMLAIRLTDSIDAALHLFFKAIEKNDNRPLYSYYTSLLETLLDHHVELKRGFEE